MIKITIEVEGMSCGMCEAHINEVVRRIEGVKKVISSSYLLQVKGQDGSHRGRRNGRQSYKRSHQGAGLRGW